jgi:hypothetical protein
MELEHFVRITFNIAENNNHYRIVNRDSFILKLLESQGCPISFDQMGRLFVHNGSIVEREVIQGKRYFEVKWKPDINEFLQGVKFCDEQLTLSGAPALSEKRAIKDVTPPLKGEIKCRE